MAEYPKEPLQVSNYWAGNSVKDLATVSDKHTSTNYRQEVKEPSVKHTITEYAREPTGSSKHTETAYAAVANELSTKHTETAYAAVANELSAKHTETAYSQMINEPSAKHTETAYNQEALELSIKHTSTNYSQEVAESSVKHTTTNYAVYPVMTSPNYTIAPYLGEPLTLSQRINMAAYPSVPAMLSPSWEGNKVVLKPLVESPKWKGNKVAKKPLLKSKKAKRAKARNPAQKSKPFKTTRTTLGKVHLFVKREDWSFTADIPKYAVERGKDISDHVQIKPAKLTLTGILFDDKKHTAAEKVKGIRKYEAEGKMLTYVGRRTRSKLLISSFDYSSEVLIGNGHEFTITLQEVRLATNANKTKKKETSKKNSAGKTQTVSKSDSNSSGTSTYVVRKGDTYWDLAKKFGTSWQELQRLNKYPPKQIPIGVTLKVK